MCFQLNPQIACPIGCKVTLIEIVWLFPIVCVSSGSSNGLYGKIHSYIVCIYVTLEHCQHNWSLLVKTQAPKFIKSPIHKIYLSNLFKISKCICPNCRNREKQHNLCCLPCVTLVRLFSIMNFQMSPQITCLKRCKFTLLAFVWFFSTVRFQMCPQSACIRRGIVTLITFV